MFRFKMEENEKRKKKKNFLEKPLYPGGAKALREFLSAHLKYPQDAIDQRIEGVVTVAYQVNDDGIVENATVVKSLHPSCDKEAIRLVRLLRYDKVSNHGVRVKVNSKLNIHFHLSPIQTCQTISYTITPSIKKFNDRTPSKPSESYNYNISW